MANSDTTQLPACTRCKSRSITPLVRDGDRQRFECQRCGDTFWSAALVGVPDPSAQTAAPFTPTPIKIAIDAPAGACSKCEKPYKRLGKKFEEHVAKCDGKKWVAPKRRGRLDRVEPLSKVEVYTRSIEALQAKKEVLEAEIRGLDAAIAEIQEKMKGAGGAAPAPFSSGGPPTP